MAVSDELLDILACPECHRPVRPEGDELVCVGCGLRYPVRDGIPMMLPDEARRTRSGGPT